MTWQCHSVDRAIYKKYGCDLPLLDKGDFCVKGFV